ncbi:MAG: TIGR02556 family CRISPR-associated protein [bacterium]|nr:TIGR02556 family CRISPR-associated protein [bacterium]
MLEGIYQIGSVQKFNVIDDLTKKIDERYLYIIKIVFEYDNNEWNFKRIDFEENSQDKKNLYCLIDGPTNGPSRTPVVLVPLEKDFIKNGQEKLDLHINNIIEKKFRKKLLNALNSFIETYNPNSELKGLIKQLQSTIEKNQERIENELKEFLIKNDEIRLKNKVILFTFIENGKELYPGEFIPIKETLEKQNKTAFTDFYIKHGFESKGKNKYCFFCHEVKDEVWGYASPYAFYTVDKGSFVSGGFNQQNAWKNYPVCPDCAIKLKVGENYVSNNLKFTFAGYHYLLIPQLLFFDTVQMENLLKRIKDYKNLSFTNSNSTKINKIEEYLVRKLGEEYNLVNFNFMFYEINKRAFNIILLIQEIPPSRLKMLIEKKDEIDERYKKLFTISRTKKDSIDIDFYFSLILEFFKGGKDDVDFKNNGLQILRNIFYLKPISWDLLIDRFISKIRKFFVNNDESNLDIFILKSLKILLYLEEIKILERRKYIMNVENPLNDFLSRFPILDEPTKRALFLEGILALKLLNIQFKDKNSKPFYSRLNGLKIDERIAKRLLPEMINKLEEYDRNYYKELEEAISYYFTQSDFSKFTVDEMSYYFALGLSLGKHYKKEDE